MPNFYQLLSIEPTATAEEIKRAFRTEIARYHPDKVQHLGKEFQEMAATRASQLTEAYRTLTNAELRAEYDRLFRDSATLAQASSAPSSASTQAPSRPASAPPPPPAPPPPTSDSAFTPPPRFASERATSDEFVRKATLGRFRQALAAEVGNVEESNSRGFDLDCVTKARGLFSRQDRQRFAIKFFSRVDRNAIQDTWGVAQKAGGPICVFVMGNSMAPPSELGEAIAELRKKARGAAKVSIIPVDVRDWSAHVPADAPAACKNVLKRLRESSITI